MPNLPIRCNDANCKNGTFYKEYKEAEISDEIKFLTKLFESESTSMISNNKNQLNTNFNFSTNDNRDLLKKLTKKIDYNSVDFSKLFDFYVGEDLGNKFDDLKVNDN